MFEGAVIEDPGEDLSAAAVEVLRSTASMRACAEAVELQAIATLVQVRRSQARTEALRRVAVHQRERAGLADRSTVAARPVRVDMEAVDRCTAQELSLALWLSPVVARARMALAEELVQERPRTFEALRSGSIDLVRARRIVDAVRTLGPGAAAEVDACGDTEAGAEGAEGVGGSHADPTEASAGGDAGSGWDPASAVEAEALYPGSVGALADLRPGRPAAELTPAQLGARLDRLVLRAAPESALRRTEAADQRRGCSLRVLPDGMALLSVTGRTELLGAAFARLDATARALLAADSRGGPTDTPAPVGSPDGANSAAAPPPASTDASRTLDQTRVDVLLATLLGHSSDLAQAPGVQVNLALVAPAGTVLAGGNAPGELAGLGPVPAPLVRALAADAAWQRWTSDPGTGQVVDVGRRRYRPSAAVADLVRARDARCRFPTCRRRARACDLDHVVPFPDGPTEPENLAALCRTHHLAKHRGGFRLRIDPDGTTTWTTPTGQQVTDPASSWGAPAPPNRDRRSETTAYPEGDSDPPPF